MPDQDGRRGPGRPRKHAGGTISYTVNFPLEHRYAIDLLAGRMSVDSADVVREAVFRYLMEKAPDTLAPDNPETWDEAGWRAHADKHDRFLGFPYDARCKKCQFRYKDTRDFAKRFYGVGPAKPSPRAYIDKGYGSRIDPRSGKVFSTDKFEELTEEDKEIGREHSENADHKEKNGILAPWRNRGTCKICAELADLLEQEQKILARKNSNGDDSDTQVQE